MREARATMWLDKALSSDCAVFDQSSVEEDESRRNNIFVNKRTCAIERGQQFSDVHKKQSTFSAKDSWVFENSRISGL